MTQRVDITFYDSYSNTDEIPNIKITQDNFTLMFVVYDEYDLPFIDETIYYPSAYYFDEGMKSIEIKRCDPNKMSQEFKDYFDEGEIENFYCLNNVNFELQPFQNSIKIELYPCKDKYEGEDYCESKEIIDEHLNNQLFMVYFRDIILTPLNFKTPVKEQINFLNTEIYRG